MTIEQIYKLYKAHPNIFTDSRNISPGCLFFALKGEKFNGNRFAFDALEKGAAYAIVDEKEYDISDNTILVKNVLRCLQELARYHREKLGIPIIAITGSNGKTTTKELISTVLSRKYRVTFTLGNLNNHIGVPLTLLSMDEKTELGVVEMGANHPYEIGELCAIADPDFGIVTNIGRAHLEGFGSFEVIKNTKAELYVHLKKKGGTIFYNHDNSLLKELAGNYPGTVSFGKTGDGLTGEPVLSGHHLGVRINFMDGTLLLNTRLTGTYNFENIMAAACIGNYFNMDPLQIQAAIQEYQPQNNRSQLIEKNELKINMDAYNANPTSMAASIESFVSAFSQPRFLILGDMLELGKHAPEEHETILQQTKKHPFEAVFLVGPHFKKAAGNFNYFTFSDVTELCGHLARNPITKGAVLVKGSRGIQLEKVLGFL